MRSGDDGGGWTHGMCFRRAERLKLHSEDVNVIDQNVYLLFSFTIHKSGVRYIHIYGHILNHF